MSGRSWAKWATRLLLSSWFLSSCPTRFSKLAVSAEIASVGCGAEKRCSELREGEALAGGEWLTSPSGNYALTVTHLPPQLSIVRTHDFFLVWEANKNQQLSTDVSRLDTDVFLRLQEGRVLLEVRDLQANLLQTLFSSPPVHEKFRRNVRLTMQDDGNLVLYGGADGMSVPWSLQTQQLQRAPPPSSAPSPNTPAAGGTSPADCMPFRNCASCTEAGCAWCISKMKCVSDEPWICAGDDDHVSSQTPVPGKYRGKGKCPSGEAVEEATRKRREAAENRRQEKEAAAREAEEEKAKLKAKRSEADPSPKCSSDEKRESEEKSAEEIARHLKKLKLRSRLHDEVPDRGSVEPYDVLEVSVTSTPSEVRKAYRKLSLLFHPDKNRGNEESRKMADAAFSDIQNAFDLLGTPDKRTAFDEASTFSKNAGDAARFAQDKKNWRGDEEFYMGDPLISTLTEGIWERRMHGDGIWFIECYAAWCPHCVHMKDFFKQAAQLLENDDVEVGAVNCVRQPRLCREVLGASAFPTFLMFNRELGMIQRFKLHGHAFQTIAQTLADWARKVSAEWRHLLASRDVEMLDTSHFLFNLPALVEEEKERKAQREADIEAGDEMEEEEEEAEKEHAERQNFHMVLFFDSLECGPCKVGMTNLRRLAASLRGLPVSIGAVNCEASEELHSLCYETLQLSAPPHRPHLRAWPAGTIEEKAHRPEGTELYNPNELEPHIVLRTLEKTLRLALADRREAGQKTGSALVAGKPSDFEDEKEEEEEEEPPPPPPEAPPDMSWHDFADTLMWDGPEQPALPPTPWKVYARPRAPAIATA